MITANCQEDQLSITSNEVLKSDLKICQKDDCDEPSIPRGKYCEKHRARKHKKCDHGKIKSRCKDCVEGGKSLCSHGKRKDNCNKCGKSYCLHGRRESTCKECGGKEICIHLIRKSVCKECGGKSLCKHNIQKSQCKECGGCIYCKHRIVKNQCRECDFIGYLSSVVRSRVYKALKENKELSSQKYLGCDIETFKIHIEKQFKEGMAWDNHGDWHIDHIIPIKYKEDDKEPSLEELIRRLHYTNTQPLWAEENIGKGNRYIG